MFDLPQLQAEVILSVENYHLYFANFNEYKNFSVLLYIFPYRLLL